MLYVYNLITGNTMKVRIYNSGLYTEQFFTKDKRVYDLIFNNDNGLDDLEYDGDLFTKYNCYDEDDQEDTYDAFLESISYWTIYFKPLIFDAETAYKCGLTPFTFDGQDYLALGGCGMDLSPKLDAYQALMDNSIDKNSQYFSQYDYFCHVVGNTITKEVSNAIQFNKSLVG